VELVASSIDLPARLPGIEYQVATRFLDDYADRLVGKAETGADVSRAGRT
jgi:hypothetical protein